MSCRLFSCVIATCFLFLVSCNQEQPIATDVVNIPATAEKGIDVSSLPKIKFSENIHDFGTITQGEKVSYEFNFVNEGNADLIISNTYASCGCTVPEAPKEPIAPGKTGAIKVTFDSSNKTGIVTKEITLLTNCIPAKIIIKIKASIFEPKTK